MAGRAAIGIDYAAGNGDVAGIVDGGASAAADAGTLAAASCRQAADVLDRIACFVLCGCFPLGFFVLLAFLRTVILEIVLDGQLTSGFRVVLFQTGMVCAACQRIAAVQLDVHVACTGDLHAGTVGAAAGRGIIQGDFGLAAGAHIGLDGVGAASTDFYIIELHLGSIARIDLDVYGVLGHLGVAFRCVVLGIRDILRGDADVIILFIVDVFGFLRDLLFAFRSFDADAAFAQVIRPRKRRRRDGGNDGKHRRRGQNTES